MEPTPPNLPQHPRNWWQRNWIWFVPTGCVTILVLIAAFIAIVFFGVSSAMKSSDAYQLAVRKAKADPRVIAALGTPIEEGMFMTGKTNVSGGSGEADISIPLSGPKAKGTLYAVATKSAGTWTFSKLALKVEGTGENIDIDPDTSP